MKPTLFQGWSITPQTVWTIGGIFVATSITYANRTSAIPARQGRHQPQREDRRPQPADRSASGGARGDRAAEDHERAAGQPAVIRPRGALCDRQQDGGLHQPASHRHRAAAPARRSAEPDAASSEAIPDGYAEGPDHQGARPDQAAEATTLLVGLFRDLGRADLLATPPDRRPDRSLDLSNMVRPFTAPAGASSILPRALRSDFRD